MSALPSAAAKPALGLGTLAAALSGIVLLAVVLPTMAVRHFHARRLTTADRDLRRLAEGLGRASTWPSDSILSGPGNRPRAEDDQWNRVAVIPLSPAMAALEAELTADPWGNAYVVRADVGAGRDRRIWVLSAGPDGILQTPFQVPDRPSGDDRGVRVP